MSGKENIFALLYLAKIMQLQIVSVQHRKRTSILYNMQNILIAYYQIMLLYFFLTSQQKYLIFQKIKNDMNYKIVSYL